MRPSKRWTLITFAGLFSIVLSIFGYFMLANAQRSSAIALTKQWARLADFPETASTPVVQVQGSIFTRQFIVQFQAPVADVQDWLQQSDGTRSIEPKINGSIETYQIEPVEGAEHAEIQFDRDTGKVKIDTYWS